MSIYYTIEPADREPIEFTYFDEWEDTTTWEEILEAWEKTLGIKLLTRDDVSFEEVIVTLLRNGFDVYESDTRVEIYESEGDVC
jgi:hypothetical protein